MSEKEEPEVDFTGPPEIREWRIDDQAPEPECWRRTFNSTSLSTWAGGWRGIKEHYKQGRGTDSRQDTRWVDVWVVGRQDPG